MTSVLLGLHTNLSLAVPFYNFTAWDQAPYWGKREKKIGVGEKKVAERSEPRGIRRSLVPG